MIQFLEGQVRNVILLAEGQGNGYLESAIVFHSFIFSKISLF